MNNRTRRITFLGSQGCPNTPPLRASLARALALLGNGLEVEDVDQDRLALDDPRRGYPTPTILIDGSDLFGMPSPKNRFPACRIYGGGLPSPDEIAYHMKHAMAAAALHGS
jgi:hypothetical protein